MPVQTNIINDPIYPVTYSISSVTTNDVIAASKFNELIGVINQERVRRRTSSASGSITAGNKILAADLNAMAAALADSGYSLSYFTTQVASSTIRATGINGLISDVKAAGAICLCDCNYCACNCNYCTCDCNYACTCDCNYS